MAVEKGEKLGEIYVDIVSKTDQLEMEMKRLKTKIDNDGKKAAGGFKKHWLAAIAKIAIAFMAFRKLMSLAKNVKNLARDATEIQGKFDVVFGHMRTSANKWAEDFARSVGRSKKSVKEWMSGLQDTFKPLGYSVEKSAELSKSLVTLAVDVASFNNQADADVIRDFTSALVGNHETVRKYGILITQTSMEQEAMNLGWKKSYKELSNLEKVQLRYNIIQNSTKDAHGDVARTADSLANREKSLEAAMDDLGVATGRLLEGPWRDMVVMLTNLSREAMKFYDALTLISKTPQMQAAQASFESYATRIMALTNAMRELEKQQAKAPTIKGAENLANVRKELARIMALAKEAISPTVVPKPTTPGEDDAARRKAEDLEKLRKKLAESKELQRLDKEMEEFIENSIKGEEKYLAAVRYGEENKRLEVWKTIDEYKNALAEQDKAREESDRRQKEALMYLEGHLNQAFNVIRSGENIIKHLADVFIAEVQRMIVKLLALKAFELALNIFGPGKAVGKIVGKGIGKFAMKGGDFKGTPSGIRKAQKGANFIVPTGFSPDKYPLLVSSGEHVKVTPKGRVGDDEARYSDLRRKIDVLNANIADQKQVLDVNISGLLEAKGPDLVMTYDKEDRLENRLT